MTNDIDKKNKQVDGKNSVTSSIWILSIIIICTIVWITWLSGLDYTQRVGLIINILTYIIGGAVTIIGVFITLEVNKNQFYATIKESTSNYEKDTELKIMPHLKIITCDKSQGEVPIYFNATVENLKLSNYNANVEVATSIKIINIGLGTAVNVNIQVGGYNGKYNENDDIDYIFDLAVNEEMMLGLQFFKLDKGEYKLTLTYLDIINKNKYKSIGKIFIEGNRGTFLWVEKHKADQGA